MGTESTIAVPASIFARKIQWALPQSDRLNYIDGIRAIAILAVIGFHARIPGFSGGFVGVDVFFVISGFLITRQIAGQMLTGCFSATDFYARRVLRILPPLLLVTLVTLFGARLFPLLPQEQHDLAKSAAATAAMMSNYYFSSGINYFSPLAEIDPLLHTWSLGVEEQYYLLAPTFISATLALAGRRNWNTTRAMLAFGAGAIAVSYITMVILAGYDPRLAFYSIMTRAWQFGLGGALAVAVLNGSAVPARLRTAVGVVGFLAIAASVALYTKHTNYPGVAASCLPTFGALLLLVCGLEEERSPLVRILASWPAVTIGMLSYSWYLWHWPLIELAHTLPVGQNSVWKEVAASSLALALSVPTYLFLERPMKALRRPDITRRFGGRIVAAGVAGSALIAIFALVLARNHVMERSLQPLDLGTPSEQIAGCRHDTSLPKFRHVSPCLVGVSGDPSVVFWGDSEGGALKPIAEWSALSAGQTALEFDKPYCPPVIGVDIDYFVMRTCAFSNDQILDWIAKQQSHPISGLVLVGLWSVYSEHETPAGTADLPRMVWQDADRPSASFPEMFNAGLGALLTALSPRRVLIVGPIPELKHVPADCLLRTQITGQSREVCTLDRREVEQRNRGAMMVLYRLAATHPNVRLIDPLEVFCDHKTCRPFGPAGVFYVDTKHLSPLGAEMLYRKFEPDFRWVYGVGAEN